MSTATLPQLPLESVAPAAIIVGRDEKNKAHAAWFDGDQITGAKAAALLMGMAFLAVTDGPVSEIAPRLPRGKLFPSGKAFVPFVKASILDELAAAVPDLKIPQVLRVVASGAVAGSGSPLPPGKTGPAAEKHFPTDWSKIKPGSHVLAHEGHAEGWWEAVVVDVKPGGHCELRWRDFPTEPRFKRHTSDIGLLPPDEPAAANG